MDYQDVKTNKLISSLRLHDLNLCKILIDVSKNDNNQTIFIASIGFKKFFSEEIIDAINQSSELILNIPQIHTSILITKIPLSKSQNIIDECLE